jgi:hypothetical protein
MARRPIALLLMCLGVLWALPALALADTGDIIEPQNSPQTPEDGWQSGTCVTDTPKCSVATPGQFFKQAAGHPPIGFTQYIIQHIDGTGNVEPAAIPIPTKEIKEPLANRTIKTLRVDLPPGLTVNPEATPRCSLEDFLHEQIVGTELKHVPQCDPGTVVGREEVTLVTNVGGAVPAPSPPLPAGNTLPKGAVVPPSEATGTKVPVFNLEPRPGEPALFGFVIAAEEVVLLETEVAWESDFHESFTIQLPGPSAPFSTLVSRLVNLGQEAGDVGAADDGNGTYINNPTTCFNPNDAATSKLYATWFRAHSYGEENPLFPNGSTPFEAQAEQGGQLVQQEECESIPFNPGLNVTPGTNQVDSPASPTVETTLDYITEDPTGQQESHLRKAVVTMPVGMGLNPSGSKGLVACTDEDFAKGQRIENNTCPKKSIIGTAEIETPPLPAGALKGKIYVGEQKSSDPTSGEEFRVLVEAKNNDLGVVVRLVGNVAANPTTGQLTATFDEQAVGPLAGPLPKGLPQVPFTSVNLKFDGPNAVLSSPPTCSPAQTNGQMEPWARPGQQVPVTSSFTLSSVPGGGACPTSLGARKFAPAYTAKTDSAEAAASTAFRVHIGRPDGEQEIKGVDVTLPKGLTGKLAGIPYCSEAALAAAAGSTGTAEKENSSCGVSSQIGVASTEAGTGPSPLKMAGKAYLTGPYKGAPLSMAVITPAVSGPFDLGTVVVRVALNVDPESGQVHAVSDVIPDVFGGVKLDLRSIDVDLDRNGFIINPTNCAAQAFTGATNGGGSNPANPAAFSSAPFNVPFQAVNCDKLGFKPKLKVDLFGPTKRAKNPRLKATLEARPGDANLASTTLVLPHALFLDQSHIGTVCTRPQLAAQACPAKSIYGSANATSPLLDGKLSGNVYLVSSNDKLPNLVADLRGQVNVRLRGVISSKNGGLKTVFPSLPDLAVSKFVLNMKGGKKSLLVNSTNTCKGKQLAKLNMKGQNGKQVKNNKFKLNINSCSKKKGKKGGSKGNKGGKK